MAGLANSKVDSNLEPEVQNKLLKHANDVRKHAKLDTLDSFLTQSGHTWIEIMIAHAKDSYESCM